MRPSPATPSDTAGIGNRLKYYIFKLFQGGGGHLKNIFRTEKMPKSSVTTIQCSIQGFSLVAIGVKGAVTGIGDGVGSSVSDQLTRDRWIDSRPFGFLPSRSSRPWLAFLMKATADDLYVVSSRVKTIKINQPSVAVVSIERISVLPEIKCIPLFFMYHLTRTQ